MVLLVFVGCVCVCYLVCYKHIGKVCIFFLGRSS